VFGADGCRRPCVGLGESDNRGSSEVGKPRIIDPRPELLPVGLLRSILVFSDAVGRRVGHHGAGPISSPPWRRTVKPIPESTALQGVGTSHRPAKALQATLIRNGRVLIAISQGFPHC